ncbi:MAG: extracellular solute-binding protein [Actinophytocola sp.]|nr:extracellular solute-binding protein [Actinophytocola sp.]
MRNRTVGTAITVSAIGLLLAACGGPPGGAGAGGDGSSAVEQHAKEVYDKLNGLTGKERTKELVRLAEEEGEVSIYTSNSDMDDVVEVFEDTYDIDVSVYRGNSESVLQRVLQEQSAGFYGVDAVETNSTELNVLNKENYLYPYESELRDKVREEGQAENWIASRFNVFVVGWNTNRVKPGEEPKSLEELAEPKWRSKVSLELDDVDWFAGMAEHYEEQGMSQQEIVDLFKRIAKNAKIVKGHTVQGELLSAGQFDVALSSYSHTIDKAADEGAPVAWRTSSGQPVEPVVIRPNGIGLTKTAENPAAATLFADFELQQAGQQVFEENFRIGSMPSDQDPLAGYDTVDVPGDFLASMKKWDRLYAEVVKGGTEVGGE